MKLFNRTPRAFAALALLSTTMIGAQAASAQPKMAPQLPGDNIALMGGVMRVTPLFHASLMLEYRGKVIYVDPVSAASLTKKADLILITHSHGDHFDKAALRRIITKNTRILAPKTVTPEMRDLTNARVFGLAPGETYGKYIAAQPLSLSVSAIPAYNIVRGPSAGKKYHPRENGWNGYVLTLGGKKIYIAGDTEATPEMKNLKNITVAFVPMNLPYTMTPQEAAAGVRAFHPRFVYPYHYRSPFNKANTNPQQFAALLRGSGIQVRLRDWYPAAAVARALKK